MPKTVYILVGTAASLYITERLLSFMLLLLVLGLR